MISLSPSKSSTFFIDLATLSISSCSKFDDISTLKDALGCIVIFCRHSAALAWATNPSEIRLRDDTKDADDVHQHFLELLVEAQMNVIDNLTYSGYVFSQDQIYYAQQILNRIFETTGRTKQIYSSIEAFEKDLYQNILNIKKNLFYQEIPE